MDEIIQLANKAMNMLDATELNNKDKILITDAIHKIRSKALTLTDVVKSLKDEDIPTFEEYTQNYGYKRIGNSNIYKNEGTYKDTETLLKEYKKEYCL